MAFVAIDDVVQNSTVLGAVDVVPEVDFKTKKQKVDSRGRGLVWKVTLNVRAPSDPDAEFVPKPELLEVKVPSEKCPEIVPGVVPVFGGWRGNTWSNGDKGGCGFAADTVSMSGSPSGKRTSAAAGSRSSDSKVGG